MMTTSLRNLIVVASLCVTALLCLPGTAGAVAAASQMNFRAEPSPGSQTDPSGAYYLLEAAAAEHTSQSLDLTNDSARPMVLKLSAVRATSGPLGGVSYATSTRAAGAATWISLGSRTIRLAPHASMRIPFTVTVPADASAGTHLAGLTIQSVDPKAGVSKRTKPGASIALHSRRVLAVQVQVPGPANDQLRIDGVSTVARADAMYLQIRLRNTGNTLVKARGQVALSGSGTFRRKFSVDTLVPSTTIEYPIKWTDSPRNGTYRAAVQLQYGTHTENWNGEFKVGKAALQQYSDRSGAPSPKSTVPTAVLVGGGLAALTVVGLLLYRRRRRAAMLSAEYWTLAHPDEMSYTGTDPYVSPDGFYSGVLIDDASLPDAGSARFRRGSAPTRPGQVE